MLAVLEAVQRGETAPRDALAQMGELPFRDLGFARVDTHRELRQGAPEAIFAEGKAPEEVEAIARALLEDDAGSVLVTRADAAARDALKRGGPDAQGEARARPRGGWRRTPRRMRGGGSRGSRDACRRRGGSWRSCRPGRRTGPW